MNLPSVYKLDMAVDLLRPKKAEDRLVRFLLKNGLGLDQESEVWRKLEAPGERTLFSFDVINEIVPGYELNLGFIKLSRDQQPSLYSMLCRSQKNPLIKEFLTFELT
ncbi:hypothetical protein N9L06_07485, partial [Mariniblastus sp.]|nr:hypothetical protein [Mariniblastus sp.]